MASALSASFSAYMAQANKKRAADATKRDALIKNAARIQAALKLVYTVDKGAKKEDQKSDKLVGVNARQVLANVLALRVKLLDLQTKNTKEQSLVKLAIIAVDKDAKDLK